MAKRIPQLIEQQVHFWSRKKNAEKGYKPTAKKFPLITVSREFGAKGAALAHALGNEIQFKVWDKDLLSVISDEIGRSEHFIKALDETRRGLLEDTIFGFMNLRETNLNYLICLVKTVEALEKMGNNIIVGRGANYISKSDLSFHVRVVRPLKKRTQDYANQEGLPKNIANEIVLAKDEERKSFISYNFKRNVDDASDYNLVLNSNTYTLEQMIEIIVNAYEMKTGFKLARTPNNPKKFA
jgi:cytidylate kinase